MYSILFLVLLNALNYVPSRISFSVVKVFARAQTNPKKTARRLGLKEN